jgi:thioredoxin 1
METALIIIATVIGAFVVLNIIARMKMKNLPTVADNQNILTLTEKNFQQQTKSKVVIVDFWAAWCAPCRMMAPVLNDVADALPGNMQVGKINVEVEKALAQKFNVRSIPTLILFKDGKEVNRFVGVKTKDFLLKEMNKINDPIPIVIGTLKGL